MGILNIQSAGGGGMAFPALKGLSAYEIAVKNGFVGTEAEWLESLGRKPLVLDAESADTYLEDSSYGDAALAAILAGRNILVRVPNADGGTYTAIYSPVYMYQLPRTANKYLYLFYLKDEKQTIDLSALGLGALEMPEYGQLKMLLSQEYNSDPLEG